MMMYGIGQFGWIGMILHFVINIGLVVGLVLLVVWAVRRGSGAGSQATLAGPGGPSAKEILQARYARGEVTRDEYQQILGDLNL